MRLRQVAPILLIPLSAIFLGCSDDKKPREPQIIESRGGVAEGEGPRAPEIIRSESFGGAGTTSAPNPYALASQDVTAPGLTLRRTESSDVQADQAFVVALLQPRGPGPPSSQLSATDQEAILNALQGAGASREDVTFDTSQVTGPYPSVNVRIPIDQLASEGPKFVSAIESVVGRAQSGARFTLQDCTAALAPLRQKAYEALQVEARDFANAISLSLGPVIAVAEVPTPVYGPPQTDPCGNNQAGPRTPSSILPLGAPPLIKLSLTLMVTHSLGASGAGMTTPFIKVSGTASTTAKADEAYVVVLLEPSGPTGTQTLTSRQRDDLMNKLKALKIDEEAVEIASTGSGSPTIISVELPVTDVKDKARDIADEIESVLGGNQLQGIWFSHSNCHAVLAEAQKHAFGTAEVKAKALAEAAGARIGELSGVEEEVQPVYGPPMPDPCNEDIAQVFGYGGPPGFRLQSFDAEPQFTVQATVAATYRLER